MKDLFNDGYVDHAIFQPAHLGEFYYNGFGQTDEAFALTKEHPDKLTYNHNFDPRNGEGGLDQLRADAEKFGLKGVKLYTAEWHGESRGWRLDDPWAYRYFEACRELGIRNIHVHKGPTIRPLDRDAFDVADVDHVATDFTDLNFVVEHVGLPRLEDFCWIATQEPNVHGGLAVAMPFIHTRPRYFAQIMGELLYWIGEDRIQFSSDYALWTPRWLVERFVDFQIPEDMTSTRRSPRTQKKKILGLNAAKMYDIPVPAELQLPDAGEPATGPRGADEAVERLQTVMAPRSRALRRRSASVVDPELDEPITDLGFVRSVAVTRAANVEVHLRLPTSFCAPNFAYLMASDAKDALTDLPWTRRVVVELDDHHDSADHQRRAGRRRRLPRHVRARGRARPRRAAGDVPREGAHRGDGTLPDRRCCAPDRVAERRSPSHARRAARRRRHRGAARAPGARSGCPTAPDALVLVDARRPRVPARGGADGAPPGPLDAHLHRRQRPLLPRPAAHPLPGRGRRPGAARRPRDLLPLITVKETPGMTTMRAVQVVGYHQHLRDDRGRRPDPRRATRRHREDRRRRGLPHRPAHPRGPVGREVQVQLPYTIGHENAGWVARGRVGGHQRARGRQGHPASAGHLRTVPRLPVRRRRALREQPHSRGSTPTAATRST